MREASISNWLPHNSALQLTSVSTLLHLGSAPLQSALQLVLDSTWLHLRSATMQLSPAASLSSISDQLIRSLVLQLISDSTFSISDQLHLRSAHTFLSSATHFGLNFVPSRISSSTTAPQLISVSSWLQFKSNPMRLSSATPF